jgi:hypothetical protein
MKITYLLAALLLVFITRDANDGSGAKRKNVARTQAHGFSYAMDKLL